MMFQLLPVCAIRRLLASRSGWRLAAPLLCAALLGGCADSYVGARAIAVYGKYNTNSCDELTALHKNMSKRVADLEALQTRAEQSSGGFVIGTAVYGPTVSDARANRRMIEETQAEKNCPRK
jgi:hypothetical protein